MPFPGASSRNTERNQQTKKEGRGTSPLLQSLRPRNHHIDQTTTEVGKPSLQGAAPKRRSLVQRLSHRPLHPEQPQDGAKVTSPVVALAGRDFSEASSPTTTASSSSPSTVLPAEKSGFRHKFSPFRGGTQRSADRTSVIPEALQGDFKNNKYAATHENLDTAALGRKGSNQPDRPYIQELVACPEDREKALARLRCKLHRQQKVATGISAEAARLTPAENRPTNTSKSAVVAEHSARRTQSKGVLTVVGDHVVKSSGTRTTPNLSLHKVIPSDKQSIETIAKSGNTSMGGCVTKGGAAVAVESGAAFAPAEGKLGGMVCQQPAPEGAHFDERDNKTQHRGMHDLNRPLMSPSTRPTDGSSSSTHSSPDMDMSKRGSDATAHLTGPNGFHSPEQPRHHPTAPAANGDDPHRQPGHSGHPGGKNNYPSPAAQEHPLKNRERRRLSLSQSEPAAPDLPGAGMRGQFVINHGQSGTGTSLEEQKPRYGPIGEDDEEAEEVDLINQSEEDDDNEEDSSNDGTTEGDSADGPYVASQGAATEANRRGMLRPNAPPQCRRLSVSGMPCNTKQLDFENKREEVKSDTGYFDTSTLLSLGIGYACKKGLKPESPNQDDFFIVRIDDWGLYGVFDGHGPYGHDVSNFVQRELPKLIYNDPDFHTNPKAALRNSFVGVHKMLETAAATHNLFDCALSGSTATVVLHRKSENKLFVAHVGDSRCVLGKLNKQGKIEHYDLTNDHKPNNEAEKRRIVASGGQVRRLEGDIPFRVFVKGRLYPGLAMSRALGDTVGAAAGVTCEPDVSEHTIDPTRDLFIALCSDGVWEFLSSQKVVEMVHSSGIRGVQVAADVIARESWNLWIQEEGNVVDDITSEIIYLDPEALAKMSLT